MIVESGKFISRDKYKIFGQVHKNLSTLSDLHTRRKKKKGKKEIKYTSQTAASGSCENLADQQLSYNVILVCPQPLTLVFY